MTPLHLAALNGHAETATALIDRGADVNAKSTDGATPLFVARLHQHTETIRILIDAGGF